MPSTTFVLDLTRSVQGAEATVSSVAALSEPPGELLVLWADAPGDAAARDLRDVLPDVVPLRVGSGPGACAWGRAVDACRGTHVVLLQPGDRLRPHAQSIWAEALARCDGAEWAIAAAGQAAYNDWWFQGDMSAFAAPLLATGAAFPECAAIVERAAWRRVIDRLPELGVDGTRAGAWLALALESPPALTAAVVADALTPARKIDADRLVPLLCDVARRDPDRLAVLVAGVGRVASGLRIAQDALLATLERIERCFGDVPRRQVAAEEWLQRSVLFEMLLSRGSRPIWIWGAGRAGLDALAWLRARAVPVEGFLDRDPQRDGQWWGGLPVRVGTAVGGAAGDRRRLVIVASMHHAAITEEFAAMGLRAGEDFAVFLPDRGARSVAA